MKAVSQWTTAALLAVSVSPVVAQHEGHGSAPPAPMNHDDMSGMDHGTMSTPKSHEGHDMMKSEDAMPASMDHSGHSMGESAMQNDTAPQGARDPNAYSGGYDFGPIPRPVLADEHNVGGLFVDRLESTNSENSSFYAYDLRGWFGRDYNRAVLKAEGDVDDGKLDEAATELLWSHAVDPFWNAQIGVRNDVGEGPDRNWLAIGLEGMAPYWFEIDATFYVGEQGRTALGVEAEYELLITQKLILQPRFETQWFGKNDAERELGSGVSDVTAGIRLRYEYVREFAPYIGVEWTGAFGGTADYLSNEGKDTKETRTVAGLRFWF